MKINLLAVAASLFVFNMSGVSDCGENPLFFITSQSFEPSVPKSGDNVSWTISYVVPENVVANKVISVDSGLINGFIPIEPTETDLCDVLVECPVSSGEYTISNTNVWPDGVSGSKVMLQSQWIDENGNELLCSKVSVTGAAKLLRAN